jgi:hypothetical protein
MTLHLTRSAPCGTLLLLRLGSSSTPLRKKRQFNRLYGAIFDRLKINVIIEYLSKIRIHTQRSVIRNRNIGEIYQDSGLLRNSIGQEMVNKLIK